MQISPLLRPILDDDSLARNLGDCEARLLFEWLYERAERLSRTAGADPSVGAMIVQLHRRVRAIAQFVYLWCECRDRGDVAQLVIQDRVVTEPRAHAIDQIPYGLDLVLAGARGQGSDGGKELVDRRAE